MDQGGVRREGAIEAVNMEVALTSLQRRGLIVSNIAPAEGDKSFLKKDITIFSRVTTREVVVLSRQMAILFQAQISALRVFRLLSAEAENPMLRKVLTAVADDIQDGGFISKALSKHPKVFSNFYVNMVKAGEESGKLDQIFSYLADYLDRNYDVTSKARNALIYPAFVISTFLVVMIVMFTIVIPKITDILGSAGTVIPWYTQVVMDISWFLVNYGIYLLVALIIATFFIVRYVRTPEGKTGFDKIKMTLPGIGSLYRKLYLSRFADNMNTMLMAGIAMIKALEVTSDVIGNDIYKKILQETMESVKGGTSLSDALIRHPEFPSILIQMIKVGEESGELGSILQTMAKFYQREVTNAVDTLVDLIEPVMIVVLGVGVGILLASVLVPIYSSVANIGS
jgi:type IV pilus assembly protein PilC